MSPGGEKKKSAWGMGFGMERILNPDNCQITVCIGFSAAYLESPWLSSANRHRWKSVTSSWAPVEEIVFSSKKRHCSLTVEQRAWRGGFGRGLPIKHSAMSLLPTADFYKRLLYVALVCGFSFLHSCFFTLWKLGSQTWGRALQTPQEHESGEATQLPSTPAIIYASCFQEWLN